MRSELASATSRSATKIADSCRWLESASCAQAKSDGSIASSSHADDEPRVRAERAAGNLQARRWPDSEERGRGGAQIDLAAAAS